MAEPSTEMNTSTTSNITFAASPSPKKSEDTATLLQLQLVEQIKECTESVSTVDTKNKKKAYRSGRGDIGLDKIMEAASHPDRVYPTSVKYKDVAPTQLANDSFRFPSREGSLAIP